MPQKDDYFSQFPDVSKDYFSQFATVEEPVKTEEPKKGLSLEGAYKTIFEPPKFISDPAKKFADTMSSPMDSDVWNARIKGFIGGATEGLASLLSPANILTLGKGRIPSMMAKGLGGIQAAHGVKEIAQGNVAEGIGDIGIGGVTGLSGMRGVMKVPPSIKTQKALPPSRYEVTPEGIAQPPKSEVISLREQLTGKKDPIESKLPDIETTPIKSEIIPTSTALTSTKETPILAGVQNSNNGILYLQFDRAGKPITPEEIKNLFPGKNINVSEFKENLLSPHLRKFRIDVFDEQGRMSSKVAKDIENQIGLGESYHDWERPFKEMYGEISGVKNITPKPHINASEASQYMDAVKSGAIPKGTTFEQFKRNEHNVGEILKKLLTDEAGELRIGNKATLPKGIDEKTFRKVHREVVDALRSGRLIDLTDIRSKSGLGIKPFNKIVDEIIKSGNLSQNIKKVAEANENIAVVNLLRALDVSKPLREQQEAIYSQVRSERIGKFASSFKEGSGREGFSKGMSQLSGEMPKIAPVTLKSNEVDELFNMIKNARITEFEKVRAGTGLSKLLDGTALPQRGELALLDKVYGAGFSERVIEMHGGLGAAGIKLTKTANTMKSMNATLDASAPLRQGLGLIHRKEFWNSWKEMYSYGFSESKFQALNKYLEERPSYLLGRESGLFLAGEELAAREEQFLTSYIGDLADKGRAGKILTSPIRASERMYVGFLNKLRADTFDNLLRDAVKAGHNPKEIAPKIAKYVNVSTGRGDLGKLSKMGEELNLVFFSPRLIASRLTVLNPKYYVDQPAFIRKEALKTLGSIATFVTTVNGLGALAGNQITLDPRNSDFLKVKSGNTRLDPAGGFSQYIVAATRAITGQTISPTSGNMRTLGEGYGTPSRLSLILGVGGNEKSFMENKFSPAASLLDVLLTGKDYAGQPISATKELRNRFIPIITQDIMELAKDDPTWAKIALTIPAMHGMGLQSFQPRNTNSNPNFSLGLGQ